MKKYTSLGELLIDYRRLNNLSQSDFAAKVNVDTRTIQRWERNVTLVKPEKEDVLVNETLLPHQLIRNLNSFIVIPTFYDFSIRKYSLSKLTNSLPDASWFKAKINHITKRIRTVIYEKDIDYIIKYMQFHKPVSNNTRRVIEESIRILPEMNLIIKDESGYYSGHSMVFPIGQKAYEKLKSREILESELRPSDLINYKTLDKPIYYGFDITADCNDNIYYIVNHLFRFIRDKKNQNYLFCSTPFRHDNFELNKQTGLKIIWEGAKGKNKFGLEIAPRFQEGNFNEFLSG